MKNRLYHIFSEINIKNIIWILVGSAIVSFGLYHIHDVADITEGGIFGFNLLIDYWLSISPAITNFILTALCFFIGWKALGKNFILYSAIATSSFSLFYALWEQTPKLFPNIADVPFIASLAGALFVGIGVGISVRAGGAQSGDDALAMAFHKFFGVKISTVYLISDLFVLLLSLTYIPLERILYSLITVVLSGQIIEIISNFDFSKIVHKK